MKARSSQTYLKSKLILRNTLEKITRKETEKQIEKKIKTKIVDLYKRKNIPAGWKTGKIYILHFLR